MLAPIMIGILISLNLVVFGMWNYWAHTPAREEFMATHFLTSFDALQAGHYETLLGAVFSHNLVWHLLANMVVLSSFGPLMRKVLGSGKFLLFYLTAGILSSLVHCLVSAYILHQPEVPALGASGAISGLILLFALMFPREKILLFWVIPLPAIFGAVALVGLDLWGLSAQARGGGLPIGHGAHLGGAMVGVLWYLLMLPPSRTMFSRDGQKNSVGRRRPVDPNDVR